jgi:hypothetical protein
MRMQEVPNSPVRMVNETMRLIAKPVAYIACALVLGCGTAYRVHSSPTDAGASARVRMPGVSLSFVPGSREVQVHRLGGNEPALLGTALGPPIVNESGDLLFPYSQVLLVKSSGAIVVEKALSSQGNDPRIVLFDNDYAIFDEGNWSLTAHSSDPEIKARETTWLWEQRKFTVASLKNEAVREFSILNHGVPISMSKGTLTTVFGQFDADLKLISDTVRIKHYSLQNMSLQQERTVVNPNLEAVEMLYFGFEPLSTMTLGDDDGLLRLTFKGLQDLKLGYTK